MAAAQSAGGEGIPEEVKREAESHLALEAAAAMLDNPISRALIPPLITLLPRASTVTLASAQVASQSPSGEPAQQPAPKPGVGVKAVAVAATAPSGPVRLSVLQGTLQRIDLELDCGPDCLLDAELR